MKAGKNPMIDTTGLSNSGLWVRRMRTAPSLSEEALSLAQVLQVWDLNENMDIDKFDATYAEISGPDLHPTWVYLVELTGRRAQGGFLFHNHPLSQVEVGEEARILAIVEPKDFMIPGALVETVNHRRMIWLQSAVGLSYTAAAQLPT